MAQKQKLHAHDTVAELRQALKESHDEAQKNRIRAIIHIKEGATHTDTAQKFVVNRSSIIYWVAAYNEHGVAGLKMSKGGRPEGNPTWDTSIFDDLTTEISKGGTYWSVPLMREWIQKKFKQDIPLNTIWYHITKLNFSYKSARPHPYQGDVEKQQAFKKGVSKKLSRHRVG